jgi:GNAT superfamily N-acetyltransferase
VSVLHAGLCSVTRACVRADFRGAGGLGHMLEFAAAWAGSLGATWFLAEVGDDNAGAKSAFERLGFRSFTADLRLGDWRGSRWCRAISKWELPG